MVDIDSEEYKKLDKRCKERGYDTERVMQLANAMRYMIIKYHENSSQVKNITCYKSKKFRLRTDNHKTDF